MAVVTTILNVDNPAIASVGGQYNWQALFIDDGDVAIMMNENGIVVRRHV